MDISIVNILFIIPVIVKVHEERFEIYAMFSEVHENVDMVRNMKNL